MADGLNADDFIEMTSFALTALLRLRASLGRSSSALILTLVLAGCGGGLAGTLPVGFVNHTQHSDADLQAIWKTAQRTLAQQVDMNPLQRVFYNVPPDIRAGGPRVLHVMPHQLLIAAVPDVSSSDLVAATATYRPDPTGLIACPQPCNVHYAATYSLFPRQVTKYAASWEFQGDNFAVIVEYEFENQILAALGYSLRWR